MLDVDITYLGNSLNTARIYGGGDHFDVRFYLLEKINSIKFKRVLDVGCGSGIILSELPKNGDKVGIDISRDILKISKILTKESLFVRGDIHFMPFRDDAFDLVFVACSFSKYDLNLAKKLETKQSPERLLSEIYRILTPNGQLFLTTPNKGHQAYRLGKKIDYPTLDKLMSKFFERFEIEGFNPFSTLLPRLCAKVPGLDSLFFILLMRFARFRPFRYIGKFFFVQAYKD